MIPGQLLPNLFLRGLGELLILHVSGERVLLGQLAVEKGKAVLKDRELLSGFAPAQVATSIEAGIVGAVCDLPGREWETLSFLGTKHCQIPTDLSATRAGLLKAVKGKEGGSLIDFEGSWYRGFHLMLEHYLLPVVTLIPLPTLRNATGLAVCDLKMATLPLPVLQSVHDVLRSQVDKRLTIAVEDVNVDQDEFTQLFGAYLKSDS
ncbi:MAG: hypothetical protein AB7Q97_07920 [Gammaproteobacteria bacterium]